MNLIRTRHYRESLGLSAEKPKKIIVKIKKKSRQEKVEIKKDPEFTVHRLSENPFDDRSNKQYQAEIREIRRFEEAKKTVTVNRSTLIELRNNTGVDRWMLESGDRVVINDGEGAAIAKDLRLQVINSKGIVENNLILEAGIDRIRMINK